MARKANPSTPTAKRAAPKRPGRAPAPRIPRYYREIVDRSPHGICVFHDNLFVHANEAWLRLYGVGSIEEVIGRPPWEFVAPQDRKRARSYAEAREKGEPAPAGYDALARRPDGTTFPVHLTVSLIPWGKGTAKLVFFEDIRDRVEAEERTRWLSRVAEQVGEGVFVADLEGNLLFANGAFARMHGFSPEEMAGQHLSLFHSPEQLAREVLPFNEKAYQEGRYTGEVNHIRKDGTPFPTEMTTSLLTDAAGKIVGLVGFARDITDRKRVEEALRASEERFRTLAETTSAAIMIYRGDRLVYVNPAWELLTGYTAEEGCARSFLEFVHPEHRQTVSERVAARLRGNPVAPRYEFKVVTKGGEERWADLSAGLIHYGGQVCGLATAFDVTDRKRAELELQEREALYRLILENVEEIVWAVELEQDPTKSTAYFMSPQVETVTGYSPEEFYADPSIWIEKIIHPQDRDQVSALTRRCIDGREPVVREYRMQHKATGEYHWMEDHVVPVAGEDGRTVRIQGVARDVTERRKTREALERRNRQLLAILTSSQAMTGFQNAGQAGRAICEAAVDAFDMVMVWIGLVVPEGTELKVLASAGRDEGYTAQVGVRWDESIWAQGPTGRAIKTRKPVVMSCDHPSFAPWREAALQRGYRAVCAVPMLHEEAVRGAINFYVADPAAFDGATLDILDIFARQATMVVVNAALYDEARFTVEELSEALGALQKSRDALREREELYRGIYRTAPLALVLWDRTCAVTDWNTQAERLFGWTRDEVLGRSFFDFLIPEPDRAQVEDVVRQLVEGSFQTRSVNENLTKDGRTILCEWNNAVLRDRGGDVVGAISLGLDITERTRSEQALRESEQRYRGLVENARGIVLLFTPDLKVTYWNEFAEEFFGFKREEILGQSLMDTIVPRTETTGRDLEDLLTQIASDPNAYASNINQNVTKDGRRVWVAWTNRPVLDAQGRVVVVLSHGTDITPFKDAEVALRESEQRYRALVDTSPDAISIVGLDGVIQMVNRRTLEMGGREMEELVGHNVLEFVPPPEVELVQDLMRETVEKGSAYAPACTFTRKDGSIFPTELHVSVMRDPQGNPRAFVAEARDISQLKRSREALRQSGNLLRTIAESSRNVVFIVGRDLRLQYANPAAARMSGRRLEELVGQPLESLVRPAACERMKTDLHRVFESGRVQVVTDTLTFTGGREVLAETHLVPQRDAEGAVTAVLGFTREVAGRDGEGAGGE